jgi:methyl-accepting chemotaxis protein
MPQTVKVKMMVFCLAIGLAPFVFMGAFSIWQGAGSIERMATGQLQAVRGIKLHALQSRIDGWFADLAMLRQDSQALTCLREAAALAEASGARPGRPMDVDTPAYQAFHARYDAHFGNYVRTLGYYDVFLMDTHGRVLFTSALESDVGADLAEGSLKRSGLGQAWNRARTGGEVFMDFAPYAPSNDAPAAFLAAAVVDNGAIVGVAALQVSLEAVNALMQERSGMGETGETYLVGRDKRMRSDSFLDPEHHSVVASFADPRRGMADTEAVRRAIEGKTGTDVVIDYNGNPVLSAYAPVRVGDTTWALLAEMDEAEAFRPVHVLQRSALLAGAVVVVLVVGVTMLVLRRILLRPFAALQDHANRVAGGDLEARSGWTFQGELAEVDAAIQGMVDNLKAKMGEAEAKGQEAAEQADKARAALEESEAQQGRVRTLMERMQTVAQQAEAIAERVSSSAEELAAQTEQVRHGAETQRDRIGETATAMEQMNATVMEVARNASDASQGSLSARERADEGSRVVEQAVQAIGKVRDLTGTLDENMRSLGERAESIGQVMNVITDIADQTNLLALNAAIEAARAGEAGRGFAVVADEVRKLAEKTMAATKEVGQSITAIQEAARRNMENMEQAAQAVHDATDLANRSGTSLQEIVGLIQASAGQVEGIATAAEEQSAASEQINRAVDEVNRIVDETTQGVVQSSQAVQELAQMSSELRELIHSLSE